MHVKPWQHVHVNVVVSGCMLCELCCHVATQCGGNSSATMSVCVIPACCVWLTASYDWLQTEFDEKPSGYVVDLIAFLRGIFTSFTNLPVSWFVCFISVSRCNLDEGKTYGSIVTVSRVLVFLSETTVYRFSSDICSTHNSYCPSRTKSVSVYTLQNRTVLVDVGKTVVRVCNPLQMS